jgi:GT2 family glycosyltransferase
MGCCLIKSDVFKRIPEPFSPYKNIDGEDLAFCRKAQEKGYKIYVDTGVQAAHISPRYIDEDFYLRYMKKIMEENNGIDPTTGGSSCRTTGTKD